MKSLKIAPSAGVCRFLTVCQVVYEQSWTGCSKTIETYQRCKLLRDARQGKLSDFVLFLIRKDLGNHALAPMEKRLEPLSCPRSLNGRVTVSDTCPMRDCVFQSQGLAYGCMILHKSIFFPNSIKLPDTIIELGTGVPISSFKRIVCLSLISSRFHLLLSKYSLEVQHQSPPLLLKSRTSLKPCYICGALYTDECDCISNKDLRRNRLFFVKRWRHLLTKGKERYLPKLKLQSELQTLPLQRFFGRFRDDLDRLSFVRFLLSTARDNSLSVNDVPFGYLWVNYHQLYPIKPRARIEVQVNEAFGMSEKTYLEAKSLFDTKESAKDASFTHFPVTRRRRIKTRYSNNVR